MEQIQEPPSEQTFTSTSPPANNKNEPKKGKKKGLLTWILALLALAGLGAAGFLWWQLTAANQSVATLTNEKNDLQSKVDDLTTQLNAAQKSASEKNPDAAPCTGTVTTAMKDNIKAAVVSKNYAALEGYMAGTVSVILAASEGMGDRSPAQAVQDMEYLSTGTAPWNFNLPESALSAYQTGFYKPYFSKGTYVGRSSDKLVVSFHFDKCGQIDVIFMAADEALLTES